MKRNTYQKETVLNVLKELRGDHPTADMVYKQVSQRIPSISRATVYRILNQSTEQGDINKLHIRESADLFDDVTSQHCHLLCNSCKKVVDLAMPYCEYIPLPQKDASGCEITGVEFTFIGICSECAKKK